MGYEEIKHKIHYIFNEQIDITDSEEKLNKLISGEFLNIKNEQNNYAKPIYKIETDWTVMTNSGNYYYTTLAQTLKNFNIDWIPFIRIAFLYKHADIKYINLYPFLHNAVYKIIEFNKESKFQTLTISKSVMLSNYYIGVSPIQVYGKFIIYVYNPNLIL